MAKRDGIPKTDPSEIEALIQRLNQSNLELRDPQLGERLLRLALSMASPLQHKNASIKRLAVRGPRHGRDRTHQKAPQSSLPESYYWSIIGDEADVRTLSINARVGAS